MKNCKPTTKLLFIKFVQKNYLMKTCFKFWFILVTFFSCKNEIKTNTVLSELKNRPVKFNPSITKFLTNL